MRTRRARRAALVATLGFGMATVLAACGGSDSDGSGTTTSAAAPDTTAASGTTTALPGTTTPTAPPATAEPLSVTAGPVTFRIPPSWSLTPDGAAFFLGENAGRTGDANLRVTLDYTGTVDALRPALCRGGGANTAAPPATVELLESGFAPVGSASAEFRFWRFDCPESEIKVEEHRVWLLPVSHVAIVEQRHLPEVLDVVRTAEVA